MRQVVRSEAVHEGAAFRTNLQLRNLSMKQLCTLLLLAFAGTTTRAQCSSVSIQISSSDTGYVQLYHAGFFLIDSGYANVCTWEVTTFNGTLVHQDTTSGLWADQSFSQYQHNVPITDSMVVSLVIENPVSGITCTLVDTLFWEETEVLPGQFIGNWAVLNSSGGIATGLDDLRPSAELDILIYPSPADDHIRIKGLPGSVSLEVVDLLGQVVAVRPDFGTEDRLDVSALPSGVYLVRLSNRNGTVLGLRKFSKR